MSETVEVVRRLYQILSETGEPAWDLLASDFEFDPSGVMPDMAPGRGREEAAPLFRSYSDMFEDFRVELEEVVRSDARQVVTEVRDGGRMHGSDAEIWNRFFHVFALKDGKIVRWSSHLTREGAIEAAELRK